MNRALLDTDIFSEISKCKNPIVMKKAESYYTTFGIYTISTITAIEVFKGFYGANQPDKAERFFSKLNTLEVLNINFEICKIAGNIFALLEKSGQPIGRFDPIIAAIAIHNDICLATGNIKHYKRIQDLGYNLRLENWKQ